RLTSTNGATGAFDQFVATAPFKAGTVIGLQSVLPLFNTSMGYTLQLDGNTVQTNAGTPGSAPFLITTQSLTPTVQTLRLNNMGMTTYNSVAGTTYDDM